MLEATFPSFLDVISPIILPEFIATSTSTDVNPNYDLSSENFWE